MQQRSTTLTPPITDSLMLKALEAIGLPETLACAEVSPTLCIQRATPAFWEYCRTSEAKAKGKSLLQVLSEADGIEDSLTQVLNGEIPRFELRRIEREAADHTATFTSLVVVPDNPDQPGEGLLVILQDTTPSGILEQKLTQQRNDIAIIQRELLNTADVLRQRNAELDSFNYTVAHDLKGPLSAISGSVAILQAVLKGNENAHIRRALGVIESTIYMMSGIIHNLLLFSRVSDSSEVSSTVEMLPVIERSLGRVAYRIEQRSVTMALPPEFPPVFGYGPWIEEVIVNLIENAIKYIGTDNEFPRVGILTRVDGDYTYYGISDNGIGITPENQAKLFTMFSRFDTDQAEGFGLGLTIVARIVQKLRGELEVESDQGKGSTFWIKLPTPGQHNFIVK